MKIPFIGQSYQDRSIRISNQQSINWYPEIEENESRNVITLQSVSGAREFTRLPITKLGIRGMHFSEAQQKLFVVAGQALFEINSEGTIIEIGNIDGTTNVSMVDRGATTDGNGNQIVITTGSSYYVFDKQGLDVISEAGAASDVAFQDGFILFTRTNTDKLFVTETASDARIINVLDFVQGGANSDLFVGLVQVERRIWVFGTDSISIYFNSGAAAFPFTLVDGGSSNGFGLAGKDAKIVQDSRVYWLSVDGRIYANSGYRPARISNFGVENSIRTYADFSDCEVSEWSENGHKFIAFSFPTADETWVYDASINMWHQRSSGLSGGIWRNRFNTSAFKKNLVADMEADVIGELDLDLFEEYGEPMVSRRITPVIHANQNLFTTDRLELVMEVGTQATQGFDPKLRLRWSDDSGFTWSNWVENDLGEVGEYQEKITWHSLGQAKNRVYDLKITDNTPRILIDCVVEGEVGEV